MMSFRLRTFWMAGLLLLAGLAARAESTLRDVALVAVGGVSSNTTEHVRAWIQANLSVVAVTLPPIEKAGASLDEIAAQAEKAAGTNHAFVIAIALPPAGVNNHGMRQTSGRAAVVNVRPMQEDKPEASVLERRLERQAVRATALLLDLDTCVNPFCALTRYSSLAELDQSGRNCCPPCSTKVIEKARSTGLKLDANSPFYIP